MKCKLFDDNHDGINGCFTVGDKSYLVKDLIEISKDLPVFDIPLAGIDLSRMPWTINDIKDFCHHYKRVSEADSKYPIILDSTGYICDGWHRLTKAILNGDSHIKAVRLTTMPEPIQ